MPRFKPTLPYTPHPANDLCILVHSEGKSEYYAFAYIYMKDFPIMSKEEFLEDNDLDEEQHRDELNEEYQEYVDINSQYKQGTKVCMILEMRVGMPMIMGIYKVENDKIRELIERSLLFPIDDEDEEHELYTMAKIKDFIDLSKIPMVEHDPTEKSPNDGYVI